MKGKFVMTEKGQKIHNEILLASINDDLPQFIEDARQASIQNNTMGQQATSQPTLRLAELFENSNGYLDRVTLKSAASNRPRACRSKPFFLPEDSFKRVQYNNPKPILPKYPGIYPPPPKTAGATPSQRVKLVGSPPATAGTLSAHQRGVTLSQSNGFLPQATHPLVLDYETLVSPRANQLGGSSGAIGSPGMTADFSSLRNQLKSDSNQLYMQGNNINMNNASPQRVNRGQGHVMSTLFEDSPERDNNQRHRLMHQGTTLWGTGTQVNFNVTEAPKKQLVVIDKQQYQKTLRERMEVKKANYLQQRELQEKKLREMVDARQNLSKDPVHIAAAYLQDLKNEDAAVNGLVYDVTFQKNRYKDRLVEYHHNKYEKSWNKLAFPQNRQRLPKIIRSKNQNNFDDLDDETQENQPTTNRLGSPSDI